MQNVDVDKWFSDLSDEQGIIAKDLRALVLSRDPKLREDLKWGQPCYSKISMIFYIQKAKKHMTLGFANGAKLDDPNGLLVGEGRLMRHVKIPVAGTIDRVALSQFVDNALALDT
ncbi:DUF1801 domain-containing protein [Roseovarius sp. Pro17]|uniref:DUF1801 domain-containing protein n=1 Tax=Roseovarius sp. Pro17 TaxID=3108175 RepID=UPI002D7885EA|nr:DUF1801 domain-containing protein [Roseovarius sp. Pro17]